MKTIQDNNFGKALRNQRVAMALTLQELSAISGVSASYLGRIETGERFPSARVLRKIAEPLGFKEDELFASAGYLSSASAEIFENGAGLGASRLDPYVVGVLSQEPVEVQRAAIGVLTILKNMAKGIPADGR